MAKKRKKVFVKLKCQECGRINYYVHKSKTLTDKEKKLGLKKFCPHCGKHTLHKEVK